jgi:cinnamoyl-CoA:phenyllactate CoA-transferase
MPIAGFGDHQVGMNLASGLLAALYRAKTTGVGDQVIVSLFHSGVWDVSLYLQSAQYGVPTAQYPIHRYEQANLLQMAHKTKDGRFVMLAMPQYDKLYPKFVSEVLGREDLVGDERFYPQTNLQKHNKEFYDIMVSEIAKMTAQELMDKMKAADLPYSLCQNWQDLLVDEQAWASDILTKVKFPNGEERTMVRTPVLFSDTDLPAYERASFMGEQTREILGSLGYSEADVNAMIEEGAAQDVKRIG